MGNTLDCPITSKETDSGVLCDVSYGASSMQGWRIDMEDAHICGAMRSSADDALLHDHAIFAVFDGHGGTFASDYAGKNLTRILCCQKRFVEYTETVQSSTAKKNNKTGSATSENQQSKLKQLLQSALLHSFLELDKEMLQAMMRSGLVHDMDPVASTKPEDDTNTSQENDWNQHHIEGDDEHVNDDDNGCEAGTTAVVVLVTPLWIVCANLGDSRAILCTSTSSGGGGEVVPLSVDHKPDDPSEKERIVKAGGLVNSGRVDGVLAVSRALGDFNYKNKSVVLTGQSTTPVPRSEEGTSGDDINVTLAAQQKVSPVPDITIVNRNNEADRFIVLACDGVWDVVNNLECSSIIAALLAEGEANMGLIGEELLDVCLKKGSRDNMTAIVVRFPGQTIGEGGGVAKRRKKRENMKNQA